MEFIIPASEGGKAAKTESDEQADIVTPSEPDEHDVAHEGEPGDPHSLPWWHPHHLMHSDTLITAIIGASGLVIVALIGLWGKRAHDRRCLRKKANR